MEKVVVLPELAYKLNDLIITLYKEDYFGFLDSAKTYVTTIFNFINTIPNQRRKRTKNPNLGTWYCKYKHNHRTTWYITFDLEDEIYLIKDITNNHSEEYWIYFDYKVVFAPTIKLYSNANVDRNQQQTLPQI